MLTEKRAGRSVKKERSHTIATVRGKRGKIIDANPTTRMGTLFTSTERHIALPIPTIPVLDASFFRREARLPRKRESRIEIRFLDYYEFLNPL